MSITLVWIVISMSQFLQGYFTMMQFKATLLDISQSDLIKGSLITGILAGLIGGTMIVFLWEKWLRTKPYKSTLLAIFISYTFVFITVAYVSGLYFHSAQLNLSIFHPDVRKEAVNYFLSFAQLYQYFFWLAVTVLTMITLLVNDKYGPGVFKDFLLGKYFHPRKEERIFMFLDMRSSTTIAEQLGEEKYFSLVRELFSDATGPIIYSKGEIYQYVGDEIVISWKMNNGLEQANCLQCFFKIQESLQKKKSEYLQKYGIFPEFKAGVHYGHVMAGEVGVVKRDIAFSGDVLNTTARIQEKCNELGVNILLSKALMDRLKLPARFNPKSMGEMLLRGKKERLTLYTV